MRDTVLLVVFATLCLFSWSDASAIERVISVGWDEPSPARLKRDISDFELKTSFTGFVVKPTRLLNGNKEVFAYNVFESGKWQWQDFQTAFNHLKAIQSPTLSQSYLLVSANPGNLDWFDDVAWVDVTNHWRFLARLAKKSGLKGFFLDIEPYYPPAKQFCYLCQEKSAVLEFDVYKKKVRQRASKIMKAVIEEFPDVEIFSTRLLSDLVQAPEHDALLENYLINHEYGLVPSFMDGWIDVLKKTDNDVVLIDGNEALSYVSNSEQDFRGSYTLLKVKAPLLLDEDNRSYFSKIFHVSHGIYLDAYLNDASNYWFINRKDSSLASRVVANMFSAIRSSDGLIWVYGEKGLWWQSYTYGNYKKWSDRIPNISEAMRYLVKKEVDKNNYLKSRNLVKDAWGLWKRSSSDQGVFVSEKKGLLLSRVSDGCISQGIPLLSDILVSVGVGVVFEEANKSYPYVSVRWKNQYGEWMSPQYDVLLSLPTGKSSAQKNQIYGTVRPPSGASRLILSLCVKAKKSTEDNILYTDPAVRILNW